MNYSLADYEEAVLTALKSLQQPQGYLKTLRGYAGDTSPDTVLADCLRGYPAVIVTIPGVSYKAVSNAYLLQRVRIVLLVAARSYRSQREARGEEAGIAQILLDIRNLLQGSNLGLEILDLNIVNEEYLGGDQALVVWWAEYELINDRIPTNY